jgi:4-hydroxy-tetrahydrodipicolinate reductase
MLRISLIGSGKLGKEIINQAREMNCEIILFSKRVDLDCVHENDFERISDNDIIIDASSSGFDQRLRYIKKPIVIATTQPIKELPDTSILRAPNGSFSWCIVKETVLRLADTGNYSFLINDIHHVHKIDEPSGTARDLGFELEKRNADYKIASMRAHNTVGLHTIYAFNNDESIKIEHQVLNRRIFAQGIIKAAKWLINKPKGIYTMQDIFYE